MQSCGSGVKGEGSDKTEIRELPSFTGFSLDTHADVFLSQGAPASFRIEAPENILSLLQAEVSRNTLTIEELENIHPSNAVKIYITMPTLKYIGVDGSGNVSGKTPFAKLKSLSIDIDGSGDVNLNVQASDIEANIDGSGTIRLKGATEDLEVNIDGSGDMEGYDLIAEDAEVDIGGSGNCQLSVSGDLYADVSGSGDVYYKGTPRLKKKISGSGKVRQAE